MTKTRTKAIFNLPFDQPLPDAEFRRLRNFLRDTLRASGYMQNWYRHYCGVGGFRDTYQPDWPKLWARHISKLPDGVELATFGVDPDNVLFVMFEKKDHPRGRMIYKSHEESPLCEWQLGGR